MTKYCLNLHKCLGYFRFRVSMTSGLLGRGLFVLLRAGGLEVVRKMGVCVRV